MPFRDYGSQVRTLLGAQLVFNLGFYAVVPFLAGAVGGEYGLAATCGGTAVLVGNAGPGWLLHLTDRHHRWPGTRGSR